MRKTFLIFLCICLIATCASSAVADVSLKRLAEHPFSPPMNTEADLRAMIERNRADVQTGLAKVGRPELYAEFMDQLPTAAIDSIQIAPGERFIWMIFRNKNTDEIKALQDVIWEGRESFTAFGFHIDKAGQRYEFIVPQICGNLTLRKVSQIPEKVAMAPEPAKTQPKMKPEPKPVVAPVARPKGGPLLDVGVSHQFDPANYVFARVGYEFPLVENVYAAGLVGGFARVGGKDGGDAVTADVLLSYLYSNRMSAGAGLGYWSDEDAVDLIINLGFPIHEKAGSFRTSFFIEGRSKVDDLFETEANRLGAGLRLQFY